MSFVSREIHTRQCCCTVGTTFDCNCHTLASISRTRRQCSNPILPFSSPLHFISSHSPFPTAPFLSPSPSLTFPFPYFLLSKSTYENETIASCLKVVTALNYSVLVTVVIVGTIHRMTLTCTMSLFFIQQ